MLSYMNVHEQLTQQSVYIKINQWPRKYTYTSKVSLLHQYEPPPLPRSVQSN